MAYEVENLVRAAQKKQIPVIPAHAVAQVLSACVCVCVLPTVTVTAVFGYDSNALLSVAAVGGMQVIWGFAALDRYKVTGVCVHIW
jgi:hypothetical protein